MKPTEILLLAINSIDLTSYMNKADIYPSFAVKPINTTHIIYTLISGIPQTNKDREPRARQEYTYELYILSNSAKTIEDIEELIIDSLNGYKSNNWTLYIDGIRDGSLEPSKYNRIIEITLEAN